ncbi:hypothetical protein BKA65DRAFT_562001 [Rhexocercosporidium sp. MPI-PUGE-AT-0058]|nr:hypothetical protein BKA65DRAFT_562001 [Rhexocercosporidium sp. MPI-PUGE-AT-0058]
MSQTSHYTFLHLNSKPFQTSMDPYRARQDWRGRSPEHRPSYTFTPSRSFDHCAPKHSQILRKAGKGFPISVITRLRLSSNNPCKKFWAWDDYNREGISTHKSFVCYQCRGQLDETKTCRMCWRDNTWVFSWMESQNAEYEMMNEVSDGDTMDDEQVGEVVTPEEWQEAGSENEDFDSISQRGQNYEHHRTISTYDYKGRDRTATSFEFEHDEGACPTVKFPMARSGRMALGSKSPCFR